jgi:hypothetical protein
MVEQLSVFLENSTGRLAELTRALGDAGIDMHALMVADTESFGVVRIICDTPQAARRILEGLGFSVTLTPVIAVEVPDRPGGLADVLESLGRADKNVEYAYCFVKPQGSSAVDVLKVDDASAVATLTAEGYRVLNAESLYVLDSA